MLTLQRYSFTVEYRKGSSLLIADTLSRAPLPETTHGHLHDELVYRVEFEDNNPELSGFQDATVHCDQTFFASSIQPIVAQSLPFDMLVAVCFGQGLTAKLRTSARTALLVHNMHTNILENHLSPTQFPHFPGNWSLRICLPSMGLPI